MALIPAAEAAEILGVDKRQVRRLARAGLIGGRRTSAGWFLDEGSVHSRATQRARAGRPLSALTAWALLKALEVTGEGLDVRSVVAEVAKEAGMDRHGARRLVERALHLPDERAFVNLVRRRADFRTYWAHPGVIQELAGEPRVSVGGARALAVLEGLAVGPSPLLVYLAQPEAARLIAKYRAKPDLAGNLEIALVPLEVPEVLRPEPGKFTSASVTYTDAMGADDARARGSARAWYRKVKKALSTVAPT